LPNTRILLFLIVACAGLGGQTNVAPSYDQPYRPQYHFSPREHWTNDPNGLVYLDGEYDLFFQYNPFGDEWGHMSWGHAVSPDPTALEATGRRNTGAERDHDLHRQYGN